MTIAYRIRAPAALAGLVAAAALAACSHGSGGTTAGVNAQAAPRMQLRTGPGSDPLAADLVEAVSNGRGPGPIDVRFALRQKPVAGQPLTVVLRLVPTTALDGMEAHFRTDDGLQLRDGAQLDAPDHPAAGASMTHEITVVPESAGVYSLMATITTTIQSEPVSRSYSIPIIVDTSPAPSAASGTQGAASPTTHP
jgi:hypothetical protein